MRELPEHSQANLWPSEVTTIGLLHAIKGVDNRAFYRWLDQNHRWSSVPTDFTSPPKTLRAYSSRPAYAIARCSLELLGNFWGTSGVANPAVRLPLVARESGAVLIEIKTEEIAVTAYCDVTLTGPRESCCPCWRNCCESHNSITTVSIRAKMTQF